MKKYVMICLLVISVGSLTGCGSVKKLKCTQTDDSNSGMKMTQEITATFKKDVATNLEMNMNVELSESYSSYSDTFVESIKKQYADYEDAKGVNVNVSSKNNIVTVSLKEDLTKMDEDTKEKLSVAGTSGSLKDAKSVLEEEGYSCKEQ